MSNKRQLKKFIHRTCGCVAGECVLAASTVDGVDVEKMDQALVDTAQLQTASLKVASFAFDKAPRDFESPRDYRRARRAYFRKAYSEFTTEFVDHVNKILAKMNEAMPKPAK